MKQGPRVLPAVVGVRIYSQDVVVVRDGQSVNGRGDRKEVREFSDASRQRLRFVAANTGSNFRTMFTLTYPNEYPSDGRTVKRHLHSFLTWLARDIGSRPSYLWFLEFQRRGAPHYHILVDWPLPRDRGDTSSFRFRVASAWYRIVGSGDSKHLSAGTRVEAVRKPGGARRYAVKYATKMKQKVVPDGYRGVGRFWGCSSDVIPTEIRTVRCTEDDVRGALEGWEYAPGAGRPLYRVLYGVRDRFSP